MRLFSRTTFTIISVLFVLLCHAQEDTTAVETIVDPYVYSNNHDALKQIEWKEDTVGYEPNYIDEQVIDDYRNNPEFNYKKRGNLKRSRTNLFNQFINTIIRLLEKLFGFDLPSWFFTLLKWLFISVIVLFALYVIARFAGLTVNFKRKSKPEIDEISFETLEENLEEVDFDYLLKQAIDKKSYRVAVRLFFLKNLQSLTNREYIQWAIDKTNNDYKYELNEGDLRSRFENTVYLFEHIWYGDFDLSEVEFQKTLNTFRDFQNSILNEK